MVDSDILGPWVMGIEGPRTRGAVGLSVIPDRA